MDNKLKWSLILAGVIIVAGLAIWDVWVLMKSFRDKQKEKLNGKLIGWVIQASHEAVEEFAEKKGKEVLEDTGLVTEIASELTIDNFTTDNIKDSIDSVAESVSKPENKKKITDLKTNDKLDTAKNKANAIKEDEIKAAAKNKIKDLMIKAVRKKLEEKCNKEAKSATEDEVKKVVEKEFDDQNDKTNIITEAKKAAVRETEKFTPEQFDALKKGIKKDAKTSLKRSEDVIKKIIIYRAIKQTADVSE